MRWRGLEGSSSKSWRNLQMKLSTVRVSTDSGSPQTSFRKAFREMTSPGCVERSFRTAVSLAVSWTIWSSGPLAQKSFKTFHFPHKVWGGAEGNIHVFYLNPGFVSEFGFQFVQIHGLSSLGICGRIIFQPGVSFMALMNSLDGCRSIDAELKLHQFKEYRFINIRSIGN